MGDLEKSLTLREIVLKKQRLVFENCWDNDPGDHTNFSVESV